MAGEAADLSGSLSGEGDVHLCELIHLKKLYVGEEVGQIVYQGPREYVLELFEPVGFKCPKRKGVVDILQEAFQSFHFGRIIRKELATPFDKSRNHPPPLTTKKYGVDKKELLKANFSRGQEHSESEVNAEILGWLMLFFMKPCTLIRADYKIDQFLGKRNSYRAGFGGK
ncbi:hypothetical protein JHK84_040534 [Glycine max]|nr:hypothetical protein JHK84_040534 [Glycine max]